MSGLAERLAQGAPLLLDGALGTELERRGQTCALPLWSAHALLEQPELVEQIHRDYVAAGADALTANTFRTQERTLRRGGLRERTRELTRRAVELARRAARYASNPPYVLGSSPTLEDCYRPDLVPDDDALAREHQAHAENLAEAGVDGLLVETMNSVREALAAATAARATGLPFCVSFVCGDDALLLSGEPLQRAAAAVAELAPNVVLVNCMPPSKLEPCLEVLHTSGLPFGMYPNLGEPAEDGNYRHTEDLTPGAFAACVEPWIRKGARIVGGCCGTQPAHISALAQSLAHHEIRPS